MTRTLRDTLIELSNQPGVAGTRGFPDKEVTDKMINQLGLDNDEILKFLKDEDVQRSVLMQAHASRVVQALTNELEEADSPNKQGITVTMLIGLKIGLIVGAAHVRANAAELHDDVLGDS